MQHVAGTLNITLLPVRSNDPHLKPPIELHQTVVDWFNTHRTHECNMHSCRYSGMKLKDATKCYCGTEIKPCTDFSYEWKNGKFHVSFNGKYIGEVPLACKPIFCFVDWKHTISFNGKEYAIRCDIRKLHSLVALYAGTSETILVNLEDKRFHRALTHCGRYSL
jgi:hypothetical protein